VAAAALAALDGSCSFAVRLLPAAPRYGQGWLQCIQAFKQICDGCVMLLHFVDLNLLLCSTVVNMETEFLNLGLDIIGLGVFNYDFGSITTESPVIKAVYGVLKGRHEGGRGGAQATCMVCIAA
jgi:hypothetical protein